MVEFLLKCQRHIQDSWLNQPGLLIAWSRKHVAKLVNSLAVEVARVLEVGFSSFPVHHMPGLDFLSQPFDDIRIRSSQILLFVRMIFMFLVRSVCIRQLGRF